MADGSANLLAKFKLQHEGIAQNLLTKTVIRHLASADLLGKFETRSLGSQDLKGHLKIRQMGSPQNLWVFFTCLQPAEDLLAHFVVRHRSNLLQGRLKAILNLVRTWAELPAKMIVKNSGSALLLGIFIVAQGSRDLKAKFHVGQNSADLLAKFHVGQNSADLLGKFHVGQNSADLLGKFEVKHSENLFAKAIIRQNSSTDLLGKFEIGQGNADLLCFFRLPQEDLFCKFAVRHEGSETLYGRIEVRRPASARLLSKMVVQRHVGSEELLCKFHVGQNSSNLKCVIRRIVPSVRNNSWTIQDDDVNQWINFVVGMGRGFIEAPTLTADAIIKKLGLNSCKIYSASASHRFEAIRFGYVAVPEWAENERLQMDAGNLLAKVIIRHEGTSRNLLAELEIRNASNQDLPAHFVAIRRQGFKDLKAKLFVMSARFTLIDEKTVSGAAVERITFTGLDLNTHKNYMLIAEWVNPVAYFGKVWAFYNGDEVPTNYRSQYLRGSSSSSSADRLNDPTIALSADSASSMAVINIGISPDGYINVVSQNRAGQGAAIEIYEFSQNHDIVQSNLTQLDLSYRRYTTDAEENGFGIGSKFRLYGYKTGISNVIDIYEVDGSTGDISAPAAYTLIPEMTKTLDLEAGDKVLLTFEANFVVSPSPSAPIGYVNLFADASQLLYNAQISISENCSSSPNRHNQRSFHAVYEAVIDETVTFTAQWKSGGGFWIYGNERKMIITHIH